MNKYLIFRTDRIGDFLLSAILIKSIKRNDPNSSIYIVASERNYNYIKSFKFIDNVVLLNNNFISKLRIINYLKSIKFTAIIIHDSKNRSNLISFFLKKNIRIMPKTNSKISYINEIKKILSNLNFNFNELDLNTLNDRIYNKSKFPDENYIQIHFDEKWIHKEYILNYYNIEPTKDEFIAFLDSVIKKTNKNLVVTTGINAPKILDEIFIDKNHPKIKFLKNLDFFEIENVIDKACLLISCHGAVSHVAAAKNIKQLDIIDNTKSDFYKKWSHHFRNYKSINRKKFADLKKEIIDFL